MTEVKELDIQALIADAQADVPSDEFVLAPPSDYAMYVKPGSTKIVKGTSEKGPWYKFTAQAVIDDATAREATNMENPTARVGFFLDVVGEDDNGKPILAKGVNKNVQLGRLLKATGTDKPGWTYTSPEGVPFKGRVVHVANKDGSRMSAEVQAYSRL